VSLGLPEGVDDARWHADETAGLPGAARRLAHLQHHQLEALPGQGGRRARPVWPAPITAIRPTRCPEPRIAPIRRERSGKAAGVCG
jgi:hypothetical protein